MAIIPVAWFAWWLLSPLVTTNEVNEDFPYAAQAVVPEGMSRGEVENVMALAAASDNQVDDSMPAMTASNDAEVARSVKAAGNFRDADSFHKGSGNATIYEIAPDQRVLRLDEFMVTNGPDLRVLLANAPNPEGHGDLDDAGYVELGKLKGNVGSQNYEIPQDFDLADAQSVVIYCKPFRVVFTVATLAKSQA